MLKLGERQTTLLDAIGRLDRISWAPVVIRRLLAGTADNFISHPYL